MRKVKELIVVEGKHDKDRLDKIVEADILCTGGLALSEQQLDVIEQASKVRGVIVMTDPDNPGKRIRDKINERVKTAKQVFVPKEKAIGKRNVGIEYVSDADLLDALENVVSFTKGNEQTISWSEYISLDLINNKKKRDYVCTRLRLGLCNNKKLFKYLNMLGYDINKLKEVALEYDRDHQ